MENIWIDYILIFILGWTIGVKVYMYKVEKYLKIFVKIHGIKLEEAVVAVDTIPTLTVEIQHDVLYLYDKKSKNFVCQGKNLDEIATLLHQHNKIPQARVEYLTRNLVIEKGKVYYES